MKPSAAQTQQTWVPVAEVIAAGVPRKTCYRRMNSGCWVWRDGAGGRDLLLEGLPHELQHVLRCGEQLELHLQPDDLPSTADRQVLAGEAARRWRLLDDFFSLPRSEQTQQRAAKLTRAISAVPDELAGLADLVRPRATATLRRTWARAKVEGPEVTLGRHGPRQKGYGAVLPPDAQVYLRWLWLDKRASSYSVAFRTYRAEARRRGWPRASYCTIRRHIKAIPADVALFARMGERRWESQAAPYVTRDYTCIAAGEWWCGDHHQFDIMVRDGELLLRPWLTGWLDLRSRALPGYEICRVPNTRSILTALVHGVRPKRRPEYERLCGVPDHALVDNGKDYRSKALQGEPLPRTLSEADTAYITGLLHRLGIRPHHALPFNAKSKIIERFFGTVCSQFAMSMADQGYTGCSPAHKPDQLREMVKQHERWLKGEIPASPFITLDELGRRFDAWLLAYHQREHRGLLQQEGAPRSPLDVVRLAGRTPRLVKDTSLELLAMEQHPCKVRKGGRIQWGRDLWYFAERLLKLPVGTEVIACRSESELGRAYIYDTAQRFVCEAISVRGIRIDGGEEARSAREEYQRYKKRLRARVRAMTDGVPVESLSPADALADAVPPPGEVCRPGVAVQQLVPDVDGVELRQVPVPNEPPTKVMAAGSSSVLAPSIGRLTLFDWEDNP